MQTEERVHVQDGKPNEEVLVRMWDTCVVAVGLFRGGAEQVQANPGVRGSSSAWY